MQLKELEASNKWQIIDLSHNSIEFIDTPELLERQIELEFLQIDFNAKFNEKKDVKIFDNRSLKRMSCKGCGFTEIHRQHFTGFDNLAELNLSANRITKIGAEAFKRNGYLKILDLSENKIIKLSPSTFSSLRQFEVLNMSSNPIELTSSKPFLKSKSLKHLIMDNCHLVDIYNETFTELKSIEAINLNDNRIEQIEVTLFALNPRLQSLFIEHNRLKFFPASILDTSKELSELCADKNAFVNNQEFRKFIKKYTDKNLRTINCSSNVKYFIETLFNPNIEDDDNEIFIDDGNPSTEKSSKFIKFHKGISNFFIGSYLTVILIMQAVAFVLLTLFLIKITKYEKLGSGDVNYANTILNDNDIYKVYKLNE